MLNSTSGREGFSSEQIELLRRKRKAASWFDMGLAGGAAVDGVAHDRAACYERALSFDACHVPAWSNLGLGGGGTVDGVYHGVVACYERALTIDPGHGNAWFNMGVAGGGTVGGVVHSAVECYERAHAIDPRFVTLANGDGAEAAGIATPAATGDYTGLGSDAARETAASSVAGAADAEARPVSVASVDADVGS
jgi:hypothetical protein